MLVGAPATPEQLAVIDAAIDLIQANLQTLRSCMVDGFWQGARGQLINLETGVERIRALSPQLANHSHG